MVAKVADYEVSDLPERQRVALRVADAYLIGMGRVTSDLRQEAASHLTQEEISEIGILLFKSIQNKVRIALGTDAPLVSIQIVAPAD